MNPELLKNLSKKFLDLLNVQIEDISVTTGHRTIVAVISSDSKNLIGPHGEHLKAINLVLRKLVEKQYGEDSASFLVDINGYHEEQMEKVRQNARILAQRARLFKHDIELDPMTSYERLVVHELFAEDPEIQTVSAGEGKFRHIVLKYAHR
jgi:spoIIIJ-associated protein